MTILLAVVAGAALGFVLARGDFCFHSTWRRFFARPSQPSLLRAYVVLLLISTPIVQLLMALDVIEPFVPAFAPVAAIGGGLLFGLGMVIARTCVSGMFYKLGAGMVAMVVAIAAWAVGDILTWRGPLKGLREELNRSSVTVTADDGSAGAATVTSLLGPAGVVLLAVIGAALAFWVFRGEQEAARTPVPEAEDGPTLTGTHLGIATAAVMVVAWLLARWHGFDYSFGTSSTPSNVWARIVHGDSSAWWIPVALISIVPGAVIAAITGGTLWVRGEDGRRFLELIGGGLIMGIGAAIAGGCNLGHSMVGVPLLSIGSIVTTVSIAAGVFVASRIPAIA